MRVVSQRGILGDVGDRESDGQPVHKAQPHNAILYTCDGTFQSSCDTSKPHAMYCDTFSNMLVILLPILEYPSYSLSDSQTVFSLIMSI